MHIRRHAATKTVTSNCPVWAAPLSSDRSCISLHIERMVSGGIQFLAHCYVLEDNIFLKKYWTL